MLRNFHEILTSKFREKWNKTFYYDAVTVFVRGTVALKGSRRRTTLIHMH